MSIGRILGRLISVAVAFAWVPSARARVFEYKDATLAAYVRGTGGLSSLGQSAFKGSIGAGNSVTGTSRWDYSGEIGGMVGFGSRFLLRLGAELIQHRPVGDAPGTDAGGTKLFTLNSSVSAFNPNVTFEYTFGLGGESRYYVMAGAGYADVVVENRFQLTGPGTSTYGLSDYNELMSGSAYSTQIGAGFETLFTDNVTFAMDLGYRYLPVTNLKYKGDANTIPHPGGVHKGDPVLDASGKQMKLDLGGLIVGVGFRFYLKFL